MTKLSVLLTLLPLFAFNAINATPPSQDFELVRQRIIVQLMKAEPDDDEVENLIETIGEDGSWSDINYLDVSRIGFDHHRHLENMLTLSRAYRKNTSMFHGSRKAKNALLAALDFWAGKDFICENWWWNQVGTPNMLVSIMLIMDDEIPEDLLLKTRPIIGRGNINASGARQSGDRIKIAGIQAKNLLFQRDEHGFDEIISVIENEIRFVTGRGLQYDYSFHHRVDRVNNTLSYGKGYAAVFAEWADYVADSKYAFSEEKIEQLIDYYLDGICKMMVYGKYPDPGAKNRSISRRGSLKPENAETPIKLLSTTTYRKEELEEIVGIRTNQARSTLSHSTFYWHSEHYTHQRPEYFTSVRMYSTRNHNMEVPYNSEGLLNHHRGDGTNHISRTGREYQDIWPVYDWQKIPGTTVMQKAELPSGENIQKVGITDFVGAVSNGMYGAAVFDFKSPHDPLEAKKAWFFFDEEYVCLGAGINSDTDMPVATTMNQCKLVDHVSVSQKKQKRVLADGNHELNGVDWVYHDGTAYLFSDSANVMMSNKTARGSWYDISKQKSTPKDEVSMEVFTLWIDHGSEVRNAAYHYTVVPSIRQDDIPRYVARKSIEVLSNTADLQAVKHSELGIYQLLFYKSGEIQISDKFILGSDSEAAIMLKTDGQTISEISVSDPSRRFEKFHLTLSIPINKTGGNFIAAWNDEKKITELSIELPRQNYAGQSITLDLSKQH